MDISVPTEATSPNPYEVYSKVVSNTVRNVIFAAIGTLVIWWLSGTWNEGAKIGFWIAVVFTGLEGAHVLFAAVVSVVINFAGRRRPGEGWMVAAVIVQLVGEAASVGLLLFLHSKIWP